MSSYVRDPDSVLDYQWNWGSFLGEGETIQSHTVTVAGVTLDSSSATDTTVTAWISGGSAGTTGRATCHIVTSAGRQQDQTIHFYTREL